MEESKDLKAGQETSYQVGDKKITMRPMTLGKMKKAMAAFQKKDADTFEMMLNSLEVILANGSNDFATRDWIEDNVTMPLATQIISDMRTINGLGDPAFFPQGGAAAKEVRPLEERTPTPSV